MRNALRVVFSLAVVAGQGCGISAEPRGTTSTPGQSPAIAVRISATDESQTINARVGDQIEIALGQQYSWQLDPPDGVVVSQAIQNYQLAAGTQAIWLATGVGRFGIRATAVAICPSGPACAPSTRLFTATITVGP
jgi:hypothetical protein